MILIHKINKCNEKIEDQRAIENQRAIEKLGEKKEIETGNKQPCYICFCEYEREEEIYKPRWRYFFQKNAYLIV